MTPPQPITRRQFLTRSAALGVPLFIPAAALGRNGTVAPSNRINMGFIGVGNQGTNDMNGFLQDERVQVLAVCDVNREGPGYWNGAVAGREHARRIVDSFYADHRDRGVFKVCATYADFRELLARKDIDAVEVATPDHWHAALTVAAAKAGKDIYCQKPLALTVADGRAMCNAVKRHGVVLQVGSQQRSDYNFRRAAELVLNGRIGKLHTVRCGLPSGWPDYGHTGSRKAPEPVPDGFDYNMWLGPAPEVPYAPARCHVNFRWILDYSGGQLTDWGGHHPDCAQWGMGTQYTGPIEIRNAKGTFPDDPLWNTATDFYFEAIYKNGVKMIVGSQEFQGVTFEGSEGTIRVNRGWHDADPKSILSSVIGPDEIRLYRSDDHFRNFIDCVMSRREPIAPVEVGHRSITICHLGNIAMRLGRKSLKWNPDTEQIIGDPIASQMLGRAYRSPWHV